MGLDFNIDAWLTPKEVLYQLEREEEMLVKQIGNGHKFLLYYLIYVLVRTQHISMAAIAELMGWTPFEVQSIVKLFERKFKDRMRNSVDKIEDE